MDWRCLCTLCLFFFFQAEDGIRDLIVTGVQTCALPISSAASSPSDAGAGGAGLADSGRARAPSPSSGAPAGRSSDPTPRPGPLQSTTPRPMDVLNSRVVPRPREALQRLPGPFADALAPLPN